MNAPGDVTDRTTDPATRRSGWARAIPVAVTAFAVGLGGGYLIGAAGPGHAGDGTEPLLEARSLDVPYGNLGPRLVEAGAIDVDLLSAELYRTGAPLTAAQRALLTEGEGGSVELDAAGAPFLLRFFWALGLTNRSAVLTEGPMTQYGEDQVVRFASTGGWTLGSAPVRELYASEPLVTLEPDQRRLLEKVAREVYRPCCDNSTYFPDCNHGMAMLGMLTLLAADDADEARMFEAAAAANALWYPAQYERLGLWFEATEGTEIRDVEPRRLVAREVASGSGFQAVLRGLGQAGLLDPAPDAGGSAC